MIVVMEAYWRGMSHATGNASTIRVARAAYPDEPITFLAEKTHLAAVREELAGVTGVTTVEIDVPPEDTRRYRRLPSDWRNVRLAFAHMRNHGRSTLILCSSYRAMLTLCSFARRLAGRPQDRIVARLHGNLNEITQPPSRNPLRQALRLDTGLSRVGKANIKVAVLEESIRTELVAMRPHLMGHVVVLEEPATPGQKVGAAPHPDKPVNFAFLGLGTRDKGADRFLTAAADVRADIGDRAAFEMIGRLHPSLRQLPMDALSRPPEDEAIPRRTFIERLERQHYVCAFYDPDYYRLGASGVLLDAIAHRKPLIVTDIPFTRDLFARFGDVGEICRTQDEVIETIKRLATGVDPERYRRQVRNLDQAAAARSVDALAAKLRAIVEG